MESSNEIKIMFWLGSMFMIAMALGLAIMALFYQKAFAKMKRKEAENLLKASLESEKKERQRIAKDLHDGVQSDLSAIRNLLVTLLKKNSNFEDSDLLKYMNESLIDLQENTRRISHNLMPTMLEQHGFSVAIENYFENLNRAGDVTFDFLNKTEVLTVSKQIEYDLFRVIQEFTVNMLKYGKITHCVVILFELQGRIALELIDDGVTFDFRAKYLQGKGLGLQNIQSRLNSMNAVLEQKTSLTGNHFLIHLK